MPPKSNVPIRICGSKTRSGCKTCKQRHVKCDERHPICSRCEKADRLCIWVQTPSQIPQPTAGANQETRSAMSKLSRHPGNFDDPHPHDNISPYGSRDMREVSAVKSFTFNLGRDLAGCFSNTFWCSILPRVAQYEPSIWHAIVAVSTLDTSARCGFNGYDTHLDVRMALRQYSKAMQELNHRLVSTENAYRKDVVLLSCALFAIFECLQDNYVSAWKHINGGMKLLVEWSHEEQVECCDSSGGYFDYKSLQPIFLSLDSQAVQVGACDLREHLSLPSIANIMQNPTSSSTIEEAHLSLNHIFNRLSRWAVWVEPSTGSGSKPDGSWMQEEGQRLQDQLEAWESAFDSRLKLAQPQPATVLLLVQKRVIQAFFDKHMAGPSEIEWDKSLQLFQEAVEYAEAYIMLTVGDYGTHTTNGRLGKSRPGKSRFIFTVAMDIVMSLFLISTKCRDAGLRKRALMMLRICGRKEGIWDSSVSAILAGKVVDLEEADALDNGYFPENARVYEIDVRMGENRSGRLVYRRLVRDVDGCHRIETIEDDLAW